MGLRAFAGHVCAVVALASGSASAQTASPSPLRLREAVAEALVHGADVASREDAVVSAKLQERLAAAPFGFRWTPSLSGGSNPGGFNTSVLGLTLSKRLPTGTDIYVNGTAESFGTGASAYRDHGYAIGFSQPLDSLFAPAATAGLSAARRAVAASTQQLADSRQQLVVSVTDAYFAVIRAARLADAGERGLERARTLHRASLARAEAGLDTQLDVLRAELLVSQAEIAVGDQRDALASAREQLNGAIGRPLDAPLEIDDTHLPAADAPLPGRDAVATALDRRIDLQGQRARVEDAKRARLVARRTLLPPMNLNVEYAQRGLGSPLASVLAPYNGWHVGLTSSYQLDRTEQAAVAVTADIAVKAAQRESADAERRATAEVRGAERAVTRADETAATQQRAREIAERQQRLAQLRYEHGLNDIAALIDAEAAVRQAETACITADLDRRLTRLRLRRAVGILSVEDLDR